MKRIITFLLALALMFTFSACKLLPLAEIGSTKDTTPSDSNAQGTTQSEGETENTKPSEGNTQNTAPSESETKNTAPTEHKTENTAPTENKTQTTAPTERETENTAPTERETENTAPTDSTGFKPIYTSKDYFDTRAYAPTGKKGNIQYLFHKPMRDTGRDYPLVIFLHGLGIEVTETKLGNCSQLTYMMMTLENESDEFGAYTLIPTTPLPNEGWWTDWQLDYLKQLIYHVVDNYNVDPKRIYLTGISMGGFTTCQLVNEMPPDTFAAAVPLSGASQMQDPQALYNTAFRIYHSVKDDIVNVSCSRNLYEQLIMYRHPKALYTEFTSGDHSSPLKKVYTDRAFYEWLFAQRLP